MTSRLLKPDVTAHEQRNVTEDAARRYFPVRMLCAAFCMAAVIVAVLVGISDPCLSRTAAIAGGCLVLWLSEAVPAYVPTLLIWAAIPLVLGRLDPQEFALPKVLAMAANPVLVLFFAGLSLSTAATKYGIDAWIAGWMVRFSGGRRPLLLATAMAGTAVLSMWMSNIAAAAMMIATLHPLLGEGDDEASFRRSMLLGVAFAADFGGIGTPIGTGPNLIAIAAISPAHAIDFLDWMWFGVPIALLMVTLSYLLLLVMYRVSGGLPMSTAVTPRLAKKGWTIVSIFGAAVCAWLLEPLHGVPAAVIGLLVAALLFGTKLLGTRDLARIDWATLLLVAGGLTLGELFDRSGLARAMTTSIDWHRMSPALVLFSLVTACALLSAVASNTAASAMMIQIGLGIAPSASMAVLVALGASMGVPFVISTPPNAIAYGQGDLRTRDFLLPGLVLTLAGCVLLVAGGPAFLRWCGIL